MDTFVHIKMKKGCEDLTPKKAHPTDACYDVYCADEEVVLHEFKIYMINTGVSMAMPKGWECTVRPRSGHSRKGLIICNSPGTIDADYRGEIAVLMRYIPESLNSAPMIFKRGDRIAQLKFEQVHNVCLIPAETLSDTGRGGGGFGSTGTGKMILGIRQNLTSYLCSKCNKEYMSVEKLEKCPECGSDVTPSKQDGLAKISTKEDKPETKKKRQKKA